MAPLEGLARPLLILHGVSGGVVVGAATHHLLWALRYRRGDGSRRRQERRFARLAAAAWTGQFALGNLIYPAYRATVRDAWFDRPDRTPAELGWVGRLFDVKEHWVALGLAAALAVAWVAPHLEPDQEREALPLYLALSAASCGAAWLGLVIGLWTATYRALGGS